MIYIFLIPVAIYLGGIILLCIGSAFKWAFKSSFKSSFKS